MRDQDRRLSKLESATAEGEIQHCILCGEGDDEAALLSERGLTADDDVMFIRLIGVKPEGFNDLGGRSQ